MEATRYIPHYTAEDYERWEGRWELWHGVPVSMAPSPNKEHNTVVDRLVWALHRALAKHKACRECSVVREVDWRIDDDLIVCPDLSVVCGPDDEKFIYRTPTLVAEVLSDSTRLRDRSAKRRLYQEHGVRYYLLLDPDGRQVSLLRFDGATESEVKPQADGYTVSLHDGCELVVDLAGVWDAGVG